MSYTIAQLTKGWQNRPGVARDVIADTQQLVGFELPADLIAFVKQSNGGSGYVDADNEEGGAWVRIDPVEDWPSRTNDHGFGEKKWVMIGSDGGGCAYAVNLKTLPAEYLRVDYISGKSEYFGTSLLELFTHLRNGTKPERQKRTGPASKPKPLPPMPKDKPLRELKGATGIILGMAVSPDGSRIVASSSSGAALVFDLTTGKLLTTAPAGAGTCAAPVGWMSNERPVACMCVPPASNDGKGLYTYRIIDALSGEEISRLDSPHWPGAGSRGAFSPDGSRLILFAPHTTQLYLDVATGETIADLPTASNHAFATAWKPDGSLIALGRRSHVTPIGWDSSNSKAPPQPDGHVLLLHPDGQQIGWIKGDKPVIGCQFDAQNRLLVVRFADVLIYDVPGSDMPGEPLAIFKVPLRTICAACFVGADRIVVATAEGMIVLFSIATGRQMRVWHSTKNQLRIITASADGKFIFTANGYENYSAVHSESKTVRVWDVDG